MDPVTVALVLGAAGTGFNLFGSSKKKKQARRQARLEREILRRKQQAALQEVGEDRKDVEHEFEGPFGLRRKGEEEAFDRGLGSSSIKNDYETELNYQKDRRMGALQRKEDAIKAGVVDSQKLYDIQKDAQELEYQLGIVNSFLQGGMYGVGQWSASTNRTT